MTNDEHITVWLQHNAWARTHEVDLRRDLPKLLDEVRRAAVVSALEQVAEVCTAQTADRIHAIIREEKR